MSGISYIKCIKISSKDTICVENFIMRRKLTFKNKNKEEKS